MFALTLIGSYKILKSFIGDMRLSSSSRELAKRITNSLLLKSFIDMLKSLTGISVTSATLECYRDERLIGLADLNFDITPLSPLDRSANWTWSSTSNGPTPFSMNWSLLESYKNPLKSLSSGRLDRVTRLKRPRLAKKEVWPEWRLADNLSPHLCSPSHSLSVLLARISPNFCNDTKIESTERSTRCQISIEIYDVIVLRWLYRFN